MSSTPGSKRPKFLKKISLNKKSAPFSEHVLSVLARNNLKIYNESSKRTLMEAVSEALFLTHAKSEKL